MFTIKNFAKEFGSKCGGKGNNMNNESLSNYSQAYAQINMDIYRSEQEKAQEARWHLREEMELSLIHI